MPGVEVGAGLEQENRKGKGQRPGLGRRDGVEGKRERQTRLNTQCVCQTQCYASSHTACEEGPIVTPIFFFFTREEVETQRDKLPAQSYEVCLL